MEVGRLNEGSPGTILGIDVGTSSLKAVVYDLADEVINMSNQSYLFLT